MTEVQTSPATEKPKVAGFVSIVVPCLNEELTIGEFVDWCCEGLRKAGAEGEVIIVDNSTDRSPEIAKERGARVAHASPSAASAGPTSRRSRTSAATT